jgi:hypothetical protein
MGGNHVSQSILTSTKKALGLSEDYTPFDPELIMHINSVLSEFHQLGIGPDAGFEITDETATWSDFLADDPRLNGAQSLLYLQVKMLFDPPTVGYVVTALEKQIEQKQWRLNTAREDIVHPVPDPVPEDVEIWVDVP